MLTSETLIEWATDCGIPHSFAEYWSEVYLDTREEVIKVNFLNWINKKYHERRTGKIS